MLKSKTWHSKQLDTESSWRFFKYELVLDDLCNKLRRDCEFIKKAIRSSRTQDDISRHPERWDDPRPPPSQQDVPWVLELFVHPPDSTHDPKLWTLRGTQKPIPPRRLTDPLANPPTWKFPCALARVHERASSLISEIQDLHIPLHQITQMVPTPKDLPDRSPTILPQYTRRRQRPSRVLTANTWCVWQQYFYLSVQCR
jgi:hypothetical protein